MAISGTDFLEVSTIYGLFSWGYVKGYTTKIWFYMIWYSTSGLGTWSGVIGPRKHGWNWATNGLKEMSHIFSHGTCIKVYQTHPVWGGWRNLELYMWVYLHSIFSVREIHNHCRHKNKTRKKNKTTTCSDSSERGPKARCEHCKHSEWN